MKIMLVVNEFPPEKIAGTAMATKALAEYLSMKGHHVCVLVTTSCPQAKQADIAPHDYELVWLPTCHIKGLGWFFRIWHSFKQANAFKPDVIQGQAVSCGLIVGVVGRLLHIPSICYAQGYDVYQASWWQKKTEIRWGCSLPDYCLAVTQDLKSEIQTIVSVKVGQMPHAFTLPALTQSRTNIRQAYGLNEHDLFVFNVARLEDFKGHDVLLQAWQQCVREFPQAQLWIAGTGSLQETLKNMVIQLNLQKNVHFLGFLPQQDVHSLMEAADIFVLPSRSEPFGIVLLEAMAHALPVVASNVGGIPEVLPKHGAAWLVPPNDNKALADAMLQALHSASYPSIKNRDYALNFIWDKQVQRFEDLYQELVK